MRIGVFFVCLFLLFPVSADALVRPPFSLKKCPAGSSSEAQPLVSKLLTQSTAQADAEKFLNTAMYCPNACYNLKASLTLTYTGIQVDVAATDMCKSKDALPNDPAQGTKRGCQKGETEPMVTLSTKDVYSRTIGFTIKDQTISKSRCDENALYASVAKFFDGLNKVQKDPAAGQQQMETALTDLKSGSDPRPNVEPLPNEPITAGKPVVAPSPTVPADSEALTKLLTEKYGVSADQAKAVVESDPDKVKAMVQKSLTNDTAGAQEIAKQLKLNDDVLKNIAQMTPPQQITPEQAAEIAKQQNPGNENTFNPNSQQNPGLAQQCGTEGLAGNIMYAESRCGKINSNPLSSVQGPFHFLCDTWSAYAKSTGNGQYADCANRNDPAISTMVMNAKMDQFANQYGSACTQAGLSLTSCQYGIHVFGETGFKNVFNAYQNNPNDSAFSLCGRALTNDACSNNASIFRNGGTVAGVFGELDRRLGGTNTQIGSIQQISSPITGFSAGLGGITNTGSPFSGAGFFNVGNYNSSATGYSTPTGYSTNSGSSSSLLSFLSGLFRSNTSQQSAPAQSQVQYPVQSQTQAVVSLIAQPQNTYVGGSVVVSWSSVGMRLDHPCITRMLSSAASSTIGISNEGSTVVTVATKGVLMFAITCAAQTGEGVVRTASVTVQ